MTSGFIGEEEAATQRPNHRTPSLPQQVQDSVKKLDASIQNNDGQGLLPIANREQQRKSSAKKKNRCQLGFSLRDSREVKTEATPQEDGLDREGGTAMAMTEIERVRISLNALSDGKRLTHRGESNNDCNATQKAKELIGNYVKEWARIEKSALSNL